jgi:transcription elongation factor GreA
MQARSLQYVTEDPNMNASPELRDSDEPVTPEGMEALRAELEELEGPRRLEMAKRIKAARELGDLKENAEYHLAKDAQAHLETRIKRIRGRLGTAVVVEPDKSGSTFTFGRTARVTDVGTGATNTWTLVGATEADPKQGKLSAESPVGRALRDAPVGEDIDLETPGGTKTFRVEELLD